jgi:hypothetical protein
VGELLFIQASIHHFILGYFQAPAEISQHFLTTLSKYPSQVLEGKPGNSTLIDNLIELHHSLNFHLYLALSFLGLLYVERYASLVDFEVSLILIIDLEPSEVHLQQLIISLQFLVVFLSGTGQVELRTGHFGLEVDMMGMVVLPALLPKALDLPHLHLCVDFSHRPPSIELPYLLLQAISLYETL